MRLNKKYLEEKQSIENKYNILHDKVYKRFYEDLQKAYCLEEEYSRELFPKYNKVISDIVSYVNVYPNDQSYNKIHKALAEAKVFDKIRCELKTISSTIYETLKKEYDVLWEPYRTNREKEYTELKEKYTVYGRLVGRTIEL